MDQITTNTDTPESTEAALSHDEEMIKVAEGIEQANDPERPDWLPEKFKSSEDMARAYANLEKKMGSPEESSDVEEQVEVEEASDDAPSANEVADVINKTGLDYDSMQNEYDESGELSQATMDTLAEKGFSNELVNSWVKGQQSLLDGYQNSVYESVGGQEAYGEMQSWASDNLSDSEIQAYDRAVSSGDIGLVKLAVSGLQTKYHTAEGSDPSLLTQGQSNNSAGGMFNSWAEVNAAMGNARYENDPAYRQQVAAKLGRSQL